MGAAEVERHQRHLDVWSLRACAVPSDKTSVQLTLEPTAHTELDLPISEQGTLFRNFT